jgi:hypothetical protein
LDPVNSTGIEQDALTQGRFARVDVSGDTDVSKVRQIHVRISKKQFHRSDRRTPRAAHTCGKLANTKEGGRKISFAGVFSRRTKPWCAVQRGRSVWWEGFRYILASFVERQSSIFMSFPREGKGLREIDFSPTPHNPPALPMPPNRRGSLF